MEQHPIPQHIAGYEFHLVGDMTLKQFAEMAGGAVAALICWTLPVSVIFKYPLMAIFGSLGVALAFMPVNEQPLDHWIANFFKSVYSPTQFIWQKSEEMPDFWKKTTYPSKPVLLEKKSLKEKRELKEYLATIPSSKTAPAFELTEEKLLQNIKALLETHGSPSSAPPPHLTDIKIHHDEEIKSNEIKIKETIKVPATKTIKVPKLKKAVQTAKPAKQDFPPTNIFSSGAFKLKRKAYKTVKPKFDPKLPMPSRPNTANILVGMILTAEGKILPDVIIEIRDKKGFPVRALRANKLGQFRIATPLKNGVYEIELEKEGYSFDIIRFEAKGKIIEPMEIRAKRKAS